MDFKKHFTPVSGIVIFILVFLSGCSANEKSNIDNTFYIEMVNFKNDSLNKNLADNIFGKVSFYKDNKLEILSLNYVTDEFPEMHYFKNAVLLDKDIKTGTKKIRIEFKGDFSFDSIKYSLQKYSYKNNNWVRTSDMGDIREIKKFEHPKNIMNEYISRMVLNIVQYSYH